MPLILIFPGRYGQRWLLAAAGLLAWYAIAGRNRLPRRRWLLIVALMAAAVAAPMVILLNPTWQERIPPPPGKPLLTVLVDRSASMGASDADDGQTRFQSAVAIAAKTAKELSSRYEVRHLFVCRKFEALIRGDLEGRKAGRLVHGHRRRRR